MGLGYLGGRSWTQVTREERFFCLRLYTLIENRGVKSFVDYLNRQHRLDLNANEPWEMAYEACFYRDLWHLNGRSGGLFSPKRTFDLALLSDTVIVVIEAKADQAFNENQLKDFRLDEEQLKKETGVSRVIMIGLASTAYAPPTCVHECFGGRLLTWRELSKLFDNDAILLRADEIYRPNAGWNTDANNANGYMSGEQLLAAHQRRENFWVGRSGGLAGPPLLHDIAIGAWRTQRYETNRQPAAPNRNWFMLTEFVKLIESLSPPT